MKFGEIAQCTKKEAIKGILFLLAYIGLILGSLWLVNRMVS